MNRRKFLKLLGALLAALPFMKWPISKQQPESELDSLVKKLKSLNYDNLEGPQHVVNRYSQILAEDEYILHFNEQENINIFTKIMALSFGVDVEIHTRAYRERGGAEIK